MAVSKTNMSLRTLALLSVILPPTALCTGFPDCVHGPLASNKVCDSTATLSKRADALIGALTVEELIANTGNESPGVSRLGLPAYNWWSEALVSIFPFHWAWNEAKAVCWVSSMVSQAAPL